MAAHRHKGTASNLLTVDRYVLLLSAAAAVGIAIVRLLIVSNYEPVTAVAIAAKVGALPTLLGTLVPVVQLFLPVVAILLILAAIVLRIRGESAASLRSIATATLAFAATLLTTPTTATWNVIRTNGETVFEDVFSKALVIAVEVLISLLVLLAIGAAITYLVKRDTELLGGWGAAAFLGSVALGIIAILMVLMVGLTIMLDSTYSIREQVPRVPAMLRSMWLPSERIQVADMDSAVVGYVLSSSDGWFAVLREDDRSIVLIRATDVTDRAVCTMVVQNALPLIPLPGAEPSHVPNCATLLSDPSRKSLVRR